VGGSAPVGAGAEGGDLSVEFCGAGEGATGGEADVSDLSRSWKKGSRRRAAVRVALITTRRYQDDDIWRVGSGSGGVCS
jgi:hypothetical protein